MPTYRKRTDPICTQWNKHGDHPDVDDVPPGIPSNAMNPGADPTFCGFIPDDNYSHGGVVVHPTDWIVDYDNSDRYLILSNEEFLDQYEEIPEKEEPNVKTAPKSVTISSHRKVSTTKK